MSGHLFQVSNLKLQGLVHHWTNADNIDHTRVNLSPSRTDYKAKIPVVHTAQYMSSLSKFKIALFRHFRAKSEICKYGCSVLGVHRKSRALPPDISYVIREGEDFVLYRFVL